MPVKTASRSVLPLKGVAKTPTGISGFDQITHGGLPKGCVSLIAGGPGCGKTLFSAEFLVRGIEQFHEAGVFIAFEETADDLARNASSLGFDLDAAIRRKKLIVDYIRIERQEFAEAGEYNLDGLFIRIESAIRQVGAKRIVLDTIEILFAGLANHPIVRTEIRRLFRWLKDQEITAVVTAERGHETLTRYGLEEYVSDCVIMLDHRTREQITTRRLRVVKLRGSAHSTNEFPFVIADKGISILPLTALSLNYKVSSERQSTGVSGIDTLLGGGVFKGSTVLLSGTAGSGKSTFACVFAESIVRSGGKCLYLTTEESPEQIVRNMKGVGLSLQKHLRSNRLRIVATRPTSEGLELHLLALYRAVEEFNPSAVVIDSVSNLIGIGNGAEVYSMLLRVIDHLKLRQISALLTSLTPAGQPLESSSVDVSSLVDTWILLRDFEESSERNRALYILKSRGMAHSNQIREFVLSERGIALLNPYLGPGGVLTGAARLNQEARDRMVESARYDQIARWQKQLDNKRRALQAQIEAMRASFESDEDELQALIAGDQRLAASAVSDRQTLSERRGGSVEASHLAG